MDHEFRAGSSSLGLEKIEIFAYTTDTLFTNSLLATLINFLYLCQRYNSSDS